MYEQRARAAGRAGGTAGRGAGNHRSRRQSGGGRERVLLGQLVVCLALFLTVFLGRGIFPGRMVQMGEEVREVISSDFDFREALAELGGVYCNPASHGEGRFVANDQWLKRLFENGQVATQYVDDKGQATMDEFWNPNGSYMAIEGITSPDGRILGKMAHSERRGTSVAMNIYGEQDMKIFEAGVKYFK